MLCTSAHYDRSSQRSLWRLPRLFHVIGMDRRTPFSREAALCSCHSSQVDEGSKPYANSINLIRFKVLIEKALRVRLATVCFFDTIHATCRIQRKSLWRFYSICVQLRLRQETPTTEVGEVGDYFTTS